jgi:hypothetical protein
MLQNCLTPYKAFLEKIAKK